MHTLLVANRGEIARRVIRGARGLGLRTVAVFEPADAGALHVREADVAVPVASYLDADAIVGAARAAAADAVHPGYGFLSERPELPRALEAAGVGWVGPSAQVIELLGDKVRAKRAAAAAGVTVVPAVDLDAALAGASTAYPLIVKAAAGGGGRGMRVVRGPGGLAAAVDAARREARGAFGSDAVFAERFVARGRHVEVQVLGDAHGNVVHLGARDCTLQRRHQKVVEEASADVPEGLCAEAVALAASVGYVSAGTVEFIVDADTGEHFFLEMNTRLQVEHPVTEAVWGVDLVALQLRIAMGERLALRAAPSGHAIEARVTAEDVGAGFLPAAGRLLRFDTPAAVAFTGPGDAGVRVDAGYAAGDEVTTRYDSLLVKVIVHAATRAEALRRMDAALAATTVLGVRTNVGFLRALLARPEVLADDLDTGLIERLPSLAPPAGAEEVAHAAAAARLAALPVGDLWDRRDGWRLGGARGTSHWRFAIDGGDPVAVALPAAPAERPRASDVGVEATRGRGGDVNAPAPAWGGDGHDGFVTAIDGDTVWVGRAGWTWRVHEPTAEEAARGAADGELRAPMPGQVLLVHAADGDAVTAGMPLVVLESMKMELTLDAPVDGVAAGLTVVAGDRVVEGQVLARVAARAPAAPAVATGDRAPAARGLAHAAATDDRVRPGGHA